MAYFGDDDIEDAAGELLDAADAVVAAWEAGDIAGAVCWLEICANDYRAVSASE